MHFWLQNGHPFVHRDIKPANILLTYELEPRICDFGLLYVTSEDPNHLRTIFQGTIAYSPAEAFSDDINIPTTKWDVFSFGVIMYELLTGLPVIEEGRIQISGSDNPGYGRHLRDHLLVLPDGLIPNILDQNAGWNTDLACKLFKFARRATHQDHVNALQASLSRPDIQEFIQDFEFMNQ